MESGTYEIPKEIPLSPLLGPLDRAGEALTRLDERLRRSDVADGVRDRSHFHEATATLLTGGALVHMEDLVLFDADVQTKLATVEVTRARSILRARRLLANTKADLVLGADSLKETMGQKTSNREWKPAQRAYLYDAAHDEDLLVEQFQAVLKESEKYPPLLAAALCWDAWLILEPVEFQAWRACLIAAAILKGRGRVRYHLPAVNWGAKASRYRRNEFQGLTTRLAGFLQWVEEAATLAYKECDRLTLAREVIGVTLREKRKGSRLGELVDLMLSRPMITVPMAVKKLAVSEPGVQKMIRELGPQAREMTGRKKYRAYGLA